MIAQKSRSQNLCFRRFNESSVLDFHSLSVLTQTVLACAVVHPCFGPFVDLKCLSVL